MKRQFMSPEVGDLLRVKYRSVRQIEVPGMLTATQCGLNRVVTDGADVAGFDRRLHRAIVAGREQQVRHHVVAPDYPLGITGADVEEEPQAAEGDPGRVDPTIDRRRDALGQLDKILRLHDLEIPADDSQSDALAAMDQYNLVVEDRQRLRLFRAGVVPDPRRQQAEPHTGRIGHLDDGRIVGHLDSFPVPDIGPLAGESVAELSFALIQLVSHGFYPFAG